MSHTYVGYDINQDAVPFTDILTHYEYVQKLRPKKSGGAIIYPINNKIRWLDLSNGQNPWMLFDKNETQLERLSIVQNEYIGEIPKELTSLKALFASNCSNLKKIPKEFINLEALYVTGTKIKKIPKTLTKLQVLMPSIHIKRIPKELKSLGVILRTDSHYNYHTYIKKIKVPLSVPLSPYCKRQNYKYSFRNTEMWKKPILFKRLNNNILNYISRF